VTSVHVEHTGDFVLPFSRDEAFPLFSPEGERSWVPGWDPEYLHPGKPSSQPGTVFRTTHHGEETLWLILQYDPRKAVAEYARITPGSRLGTVKVECTGEIGGATRVRVRYSLTAVSAAGNAVLAGLTADGYARMLEEWRVMIVRENLRGE
jgi:hypothetical protein